MSGIQDAGLAGCRVAVMAGGYSAEREISLQSGAEVARNLNLAGFEAVLVKVERAGWSAVMEGEDISVDRNDFSFQLNSERITFDCAFIAVHGTPGEDGLLPAYFELIGVPHTTCSTLAAALTFHKALCKELVRNCGVGLARSEVLRPGESSENDLNFPLFVKPNQNGSSCGISLAHNQGELEIALAEGFKYDTELLLEERISGVEVTCGLVRIAEELEVLPLTEIVSGSDHEFFDYTAKYTAGEAQEITPARISAELTSKCMDISRNIYRHLNLSGLVRIDYILDGDRFYFLEVNTVPGMSSASIAPKMALEAGYSLPDFYATLVREALSMPRSAPESQLKSVD